jgi:hypothetical protein
MAMNSVNTNVGAMVALQSLNRTGDALEATQKRIATGSASPTPRTTAPPLRSRSRCARTWRG